MVEQEDKDPLKEELQLPYVLSEGASIPDHKNTNLLQGWNIAFVFALGGIIALCTLRPDPYLTILKFVPDGLLMTFKVTILSICIAIPIGLITGLGKLSRNPVINLIASTYIEIIRGIPLLMQLFYIYYALGAFLQVSPLVAAVCSLSFCYGAYMGEVFRAGILAVNKGQTEAARSLGFTRYQTLTIIILPQAMRTILPPLGNECIALLKDTSLVSIIAVADLLRRSREYASQTFEYFETYTIIALVYLLITLILSKGVSKLERRLSHYDNEEE